MDLIKSHVKNLYRNAERKYLEKRDFFYKEQICFEKRHEESKKILLGSDLLGNIYEKNRDDDGFLYIKYTGENTFG